MLLFRNYIVVIRKFTTDDLYAAKNLEKLYQSYFPAQADSPYIFLAACIAAKYLLELGKRPEKIPSLSAVYAAADHYLCMLPERRLMRLKKLPLDGPERAEVVLYALMLGIQSLDLFNEFALACGVLISEDLRGKAKAYYEAFQ